MKGTKEMKEYYQQPDSVEYWVWKYWIKQTLISFSIVIFIIYSLRKLIKV